MEKVLVKSIFRETEKFMGKDVEVSGWVRTIRASNAFGFIELNDGSFFKNIQIVFESNLENYKEIAKLGTGSAVKVLGKVVESAGDKQPFEIKAEKVEVVGTSDEDCRNKKGEDFQENRKRRTEGYRNKKSESN